MTTHRHLLIVVDYVPADVLAKTQSTIVDSACAWWHFFSNVWIVCTTEPLATWQTRASSLVAGHPAAHLLVLELQGHSPRNGLLPNDAWEWLNKHHL